MTSLEEFYFCELVETGFHGENWFQCPIIQEAHNSEINRMFSSHDHRDAH